jgi:WD40 repeat protein
LEPIVANPPSTVDIQYQVDPGYAELFERIGASPHQSCLLVTSREKPAAIVPLEGEKLAVRTLAIAGLNSSVSEALFDAKGLSASSPDRERLQTIYSGNPLALNIVATSIYDLFDGRLLATCSGDGTIRLWDIATWTVVQILTGYRNWLFAIEFSPDSQQLAIGNDGYLIKIWHLSTQQQIATLRGHTTWVSTLKFSPDGKLLITASGDRYAYLWDTNTWQELYRWQGYSNWIESVAFDPTGTKLITGGQDGIIREWDLQTKAILQTFPGQQMCLWSVDL